MLTGIGIIWFNRFPTSPSRLYSSVNSSEYDQSSPVYDSSPGLEHEVEAPSLVSSSSQFSSPENYNMNSQNKLIQEL